MKRAVSVLLVLCVCAVVSRIGQEQILPTSPFSIGGVKLGMTRAELVARLGEPDSDEEGLLIFWGDRGDTYVTLDAEKRVKGVQGSRLELKGVDCSPAEPHGELPDRLWSFLGEPDWTSGDGSFVHDSGYDRYHLVLQFGCGGWFFFLGKRW